MTGFPAGQCSNPVGIRYEKKYEEKYEKKYEENIEVEDEDPAAEVSTKLGPGGPVENIFGAILPARVTALPKVAFLRIGSTLSLATLHFTLCPPLCK